MISVPDVGTRIVARVRERGFCPARAATRRPRRRRPANGPSRADRRLQRLPLPGSRLAKSSRAGSIPTRSQRGSCENTAAGATATTPCGFVGASSATPTWASHPRCGAVRARLLLRLGLPGSNHLIRYVAWIAQGRSASGPAVCASSSAAAAVPGHVVRAWAGSVIFINGLLDQLPLDARDLFGAERLGRNVRRTAYLGRGERG